MLINREKVLAFEWPECRRFHEDVSLLITINIVEHKAWQVLNFPCLKVLLLTVIKILKDQLDRGVLEYLEGPYRNAWFLVKKKKPRE